jgi:DNA adenine methylase
MNIALEIKFNSAAFRQLPRASGLFERNLQLKPYLKWAGGKRQLLPEIKKYLPLNMNNYVYYEPFIGAGAVFFEIQPEKAFINDSNTQLIITYTAIKENVDDLIDLLHYHKKNNDRDYFYKIRNLDRDKEIFEKLTGIEKAARFIYLNKTCYNGLYRVNSQGLFNAPYGYYKNPVICEEDLLKSISVLLSRKKTRITNVDFEDAVQSADEHSFVYFDPPYHSQNNTNFTGYQPGGFGNDEQIRLNNVYRRLTKRKVKCLLSNSDTKFIRELYDHESFDLIPVMARRNINSDTNGRGKVNELLIKNWKD